MKFIKYVGHIPKPYKHYSKHTDFYENHVYSCFLYPDAVNLY